MRKPLSALGLSLFTLVGCAQQEPAVAPLAAPPAASTSPVAVAPSPAADVPKEPPKPVELTPEQVAKAHQECWAAFNAKDMARFGACYTDNATSEAVDQGMPSLVGKDIVERGVKSFVAAFPDAMGEAQLTLVNGSHIASVVLVTGTQKGPMPGPNGEVAPTNKKIGYLLGQTADTQSGKSVREQQYFDAHTMLGQLGLAPGPVRKAQEPSAGEKPVVIATGNDAEKANLETFKKYSEALDKHDVTGTDAVLTDDFVYSDQAGPADLTGKKEATRGLKEMWKAFSDAKMTPTTTWAAGDYVVSSGLFTGTNDGPMPSMKLFKKTGKHLSLSYLSIAQLQGGKIKRQWLFTNGMAFAGQLGLLPPPKEEKNKPAAGAEAKGAKSEAKPATGAEAKGAKSEAKPATAAPAGGTAKAAATPATTPAKPAAPAPAPAPAPAK